MPLRVPFTCAVCFETVLLVLGFLLLALSAGGPWDFQRAHLQSLSPNQTCTLEYSRTWIAPKPWCTRISKGDGCHEIFNQTNPCTAVWSYCHSNDADGSCDDQTRSFYISFGLVLTCVMLVGSTIYHCTPCSRRFGMSCVYVWKLTIVIFGWTLAIASLVLYAILSPAYNQEDCHNSIFGYDCDTFWGTTYPNISNSTIYGQRIKKVEIVWGPFFWNFVLVGVVCILISFVIKMVSLSKRRTMIPYELIIHDGHDYASDDPNMRSFEN